MNPLDHTPLFVYTLALTLTPGPSALLIAVTGARFGVLRCTPHLVGSLFGYELQLLAAASGMGAAVLGNTTLQTMLQLICTGYLLWLGWRMLRSRPGAAAADSTPLTWQAAALLQLSNPKSWLTALASAGLYLPKGAATGQPAGFLLYAGAAGVTGLATWAIAGAALQRRLRNPACQAAVNRSMAATLTLTALWGLVGALKP
jgi:threonine/homoserine/homoserine lactone efflux protein